MPVIYSYDAREVVVCGEGQYSTSELKERVIEALDDPRCPTDAVLLLDLRSSLSLALRSSGDLRDMAEFLAMHASRFGSRLGMVVNGDLGYGLLRLGAAYAEGQGMTAAVFRDLDEAKAWLLA